MAAVAVIVNKSAEVKNNQPLSLNVVKLHYFCVPSFDLSAVTRVLSNSINTKGAKKKKKKLWLEPLLHFLISCLMIWRGTLSTDAFIAHEGLSEIDNKAQFCMIPTKAGEVARASSVGYSVWLNSNVKYKLCHPGATMDCLNNVLMRWVWLS